MKQFPILFLVILVMTTSLVSAYSSSDDLESDNSDWIFSGSVSVSAEQSHSGTNSLKVSDTSSSSDANMKHHMIIGVSGNYVLEYYVYIAPNSIGQYYICNIAHGPVIQCGESDGVQFTYLNSANSMTNVNYAGADIPKNTWSKIRLEVTNFVTFTIYVDSNNLGTYTGYSGTPYDGYFKTGTFPVGGYYNGVGVVYYDDFSISGDAYFGEDFPTEIAPVADFTVDKTSGLVGSEFSFTDLSTNAPTAWNWTFGDGGTASTANPSHIYTEAGTYTVSLTVTNSAGSDTETKTDLITISEPGDIILISLPKNDGINGTFYNTQIQAQNESSYSMVTNAEWLNINHTSGQLYGIARSGEWYVNVTITDLLSGESINYNYTITVPVETVEDPDELPPVNDTDIKIDYGSIIIICAIVIVAVGIIALWKIGKVGILIIIIGIVLIFQRIRGYL